MYNNKGLYDVCHKIFKKRSLNTVFLYSIAILINSSMKKIITLSLLTCCTLFSMAQLVTPFSIRYQATQKGGIRFLSNSILSCNGGTGCTSGRAEVPPAGTSQNNSFTMAYIDMDGNAATFSSSSDSLALPSCSQISGRAYTGEP